MHKNSYLNFVVNLTTYKPKYVALRIFLNAAVAIILFSIIRLISFEKLSGNVSQTSAYLMIIVVFNSVSEGNLLAFKLLNKYERLRNKLIIRIISFVFITWLLTLMWLKFAEIVFVDERILQYNITQITLVAGLLIIVIHLLIAIISHLYKEWLSNKKEIEALKQAKLLSDYNLLKDRLNPHFLFNNLSVLKSLIQYNPGEAVTFTQNFTNVYRYVLKSHEENLVQLEEELKFLESYIDLHKERIGAGLLVDINIDKDSYTKKIPPLSLQLLIENAIKHNTANKLRPLRITIYTSEHKLIVKNNLNIKDTTYSTNTGLKTLNAQYKYIANQEISVIEDKTNFTVELPLI